MFKWQRQQVIWRDNDPDVTFQEGMKGGRLTQFSPDDQSGDGFVKDCITTSAREGWKGLKTSKPLRLPNIAGGIPVPREEVNKPSNAGH